jgi:S-adenosylmethionine-diacylglycerol 3-amino-3-carboxypropyl transferase
MSDELNPLMDAGVLRYSSVWEDIELLYEGLEIGPEDDVLSITSAGDNVLGLLLKEPNSITAVDGNAAQNALLELKMAGIAGLGYDEFLDLLGIGNGYEPLNLYASVCDSLSPSARSFWDENPLLLEHGLIQQGKLEQYFGVFQREHLPRIHEESHITRLLNEEDLAQQELYFDTVWNTDEFAQAFKEYFNEENMGRSGRDPAQFKYVQEEAGSFFYNRFCNLCRSMPLKGNYYISRFLTSQYQDELAMPAYLLEDNFMKLRELLPKIRIVTADLQTVLEREPDNSFSKGNLSNLFEYLSEADTEKLLRTLHHTFRNGGILAYWNLLVPRRRPDSMSSLLEPMDDVSRPLWERDRSWFYRDFVLERVIK